MNIEKLDIDGKELSYVDEGEGDVILFLHGWSITPYSYSENIESLSKHFRVIAPFYRPFMYPKQQMVAMLSLLLEKLAIPHVIVIGHSASGVWALSFTKTYPHSVKGLVLIDSLGVDTRHSLTSWIGTWGYHVMHLFQNAKHSSNFVGLIKDFLSQIVTYPKTLLYEIEEALGQDLSIMLQQIHVPLLILWGKHDDLTPVEQAYMMQRFNHGSTVAVISGNHDWLKQHPEKLSEKVVQFAKHL